MSGRGGGAGARRWFELPATGLVAALALLAATAAPARAQNPAAGSLVRVDSIAARGNVRLAEQAVTGVAGIQPGTMNSGYDIQRAIKNLWATGQYEDIAVSVDGSLWAQRADHRGRGAADDAARADHRTGVGVRRRRDRGGVPAGGRAAVAQRPGQGRGVHPRGAEAERGPFRAHRTEGGAGSGRRGQGGRRARGRRGAAGHDRPGHLQRQRALCRRRIARRDEHQAGGLPVVPPPEATTT